MKELGEALKLLLMKIGDFFDILDLSFLVSGIASASAIFLGAKFCGVDIKPLLSSKLWLLIGGLFCYISGLASFSVGRWLRQTLIPLFRRTKREADFDQRFRRVLNGHGLSDQEPFKSYLEREDSRGIWRLYVRLWAEIRHAREVVPSLQLLRRYWVMAATYDGIAVSFLLWAILTFLAAFDLFGLTLISRPLGLLSGCGLIDRKSVV